MKTIQPQNLHMDIRLRLYIASVSELESELESVEVEVEVEVKDCCSLEFQKTLTLTKSLKAINADKTA